MNAMCVRAFLGSMLGLAGAVAVSVFIGHHGGYWLVMEVPAFVGCILAAVFLLFFALEEFDW